MSKGGGVVEGSMVEESPREDTVDHGVGVEMKMLIERSNR